MFFSLETCILDVWERTLQREYRGAWKSALKLQRGENDVRREGFWKVIAGMGMAAVLFLGRGIAADAATYSDLFDADYYAKKNPDVAQVFGSDPGVLFSHYMNLGIHEGRNAGPLFDVKMYRKQNSDLEELFADNWEAYVTHYLSEGMYEGRVGYGELFDVASYLRRSSDLRNVYGCDLVKLYEHYLTRGKTEGRNASWELTAEEKDEQKKLAPTQVLTGRAVSRKAKRLFDIVNEERAAWKMNALVWDVSLAELAEERAKELPFKFSHIRPNGKNIYEYLVDEELISSWYNDEEKLHNALMKDLAAGKTIVDPVLTKIGIACYETGGVYYWCELFKE